jgi:hypothetical protein
VLGALPFELRCAILRHLYASAIHSVPLLHRMADDDVFLTDVCLRLQAYSTAAQSFLYQRGEAGVGVGGGEKSYSEAPPDASEPHTCLCVGLDVSTIPQHLPLKNGALLPGTIKDADCVPWLFVTRVSPR